VTITGRSTELSCFGGGYQLSADTDKGVRERVLAKEVIMKNLEVKLTIAAIVFMMLFCIYTFVGIAQDVIAAPAAIWLFLLVILLPGALSLIGIKYSSARYERWWVRIFFSWLGAIGCYVLWGSMDHEERELLLHPVRLAECVGLLWLVFRAFVWLASLKDKWLERRDRREHERDPAGADAYAAWQRNRDEASKLEEDRELHEQAPPSRLVAAGTDVADRTASTLAIDSTSNLVRLERIDLAYRAAIRPDSDIQKALGTRQNPRANRVAQDPPGGGSKAKGREPPG
jgi:hypothetical protein